MRFANGGMLSTGRTSFMLSDGRFGVFGEGGPELGFFPLKRGRDGKLGVQQVPDEQGGRTVVQTTNVNMTVMANDPNAFRKSAGQAVRDAKRAARLR